MNPIYRAPTNRDGKGGRLMNGYAIAGIRPLAFAVVLIMANTTILRGQRDADEMIFEAPTLVPANTTRRPEGVSRASNSAQISKNKSEPAGRSSVIQVGGTMTLSSPRTPIPGTEPNKGMTSSTSNQNRRPSPVVAGSAAPTGSATPAGSGVATAGHVDPYQGLTADGGDPALKRRRQVPLPLPMFMTPTDRGAPPSVKGSYLGLNSGETATERLIQMRAKMIDDERQIEELRQQNVGLLSRVKERDEQVLAAVREIKLARKELGLARNDLDRLRGDLQTLREKVRTAEREHSAVLQSMGPLLQQLLESDDVGSLPPHPTE